MIGDVLEILDDGYDANIDSVRVTNIHNTEIVPDTVPSDYPAIFIANENGNIYIKDNGN